MHCGYINMGVSLWVCLYWCMRAGVGSSVRNPAVRSHIFMQTRQDGCEYCWTWYNGSDGQIIESGNCVAILMYNCCE